MDAVRPCTITLATNTADPHLEFRDLRRFSDGSGFTCQLLVRSHGFFAQRPFYFSDRSFRAALPALREMDLNLQGEARLEEDWEHDQFLLFEMHAQGHVFVSGQLVLLDGGSNRLSFSFQTDQTCLAPLIHSLELFSDAPRNV
jgi:hypothetical protein